MKFPIFRLVILISRMSQNWIRSGGYSETRGSLSKTMVAWKKKRGVMCLVDRCRKLF